MWKPRNKRVLGMFLEREFLCNITKFWLKLCEIPRGLKKLKHKGVQWYNIDIQIFNNLWVIDNAITHKL